MEQAKDTQEILAVQTATEQQNYSQTEKIEESTQSSIVVSEEGEEAQKEENPFWLSWYSAGMLLSLGFFLYYFPRLIGFPSNVFLVTDFIAVFIDTIGSLLVLLLLSITFPKIMGNIITISALSFLGCIVIITVLRLAVRDGVIAIFLLCFQIFAVLWGMLLIYVVFYVLYQAKHAKESIRAFLQKVTVKNVFTLLLSVLGAITVIVPFIQLILSFISGKH